MQPLQKKIIWLMLSCMLSACMVGPNYVRPCIDVPARYKEVPKHWKMASPRDTMNRGQWWTVFHDTKLNMLENKVLVSNQNIANAEAQYCQARALLDAARANLYPTLGATVSLARQKQGNGSTSFVSSTSTGVATTGTSTAANIFTNHSWILDAAWEPDIWGSVRRTIEAGQANADASAAQLAAVQLSMQATLAQTYFQLRALDRDQRILNDTVTEYTQALKLTKNRYHSGVATLSDVVQADTQLDNARAAAINNHIARAQFEHAIAVLLGVAPADFSLSEIPLTKTPPAIPVSVPSQLLERRPDVANAERLAKAANAQIGIAIAAYFPTVTLTGTASEQQKDYAHWFSFPLINWSIGAQLAETILDGGLRQATTAAARANYQATVATYRQTVLAAFQDVEDNLVSLNYLKRQSVVQNKAAADARLALQLMLNQYKAGTVAYSDVITAQNAAYTAEKAAADVTGQRMVSTVGLIKAMGGGFAGLC